MRQWTVQCKVEQRSVHNGVHSRMSMVVPSKKLGRVEESVCGVLSGAVPRAHHRINARPPLRGRKLNPMHSFHRAVVTAVAITALATAARPLAAQTVAECYEKVLTLCAEAMDGAKWYEKVAVGVVCTAMLAGCNTTVVISK